MQIQDHEVEIQRHILEVMSNGHVRVAVMGNVDAGKSTLIGTLCNSQLDDGNGLNRKLVTKFKHELESGRTSTITQHLMAFDKAGEAIVAPRNVGRYREAYLAKHAYERTLSLMDVAGHEKYFKTTIAGLSCGMGDYALVLVNASQGVTHMTAHHLSLCQMCGIPVTVVITKVDSAPSDVLKHTRSMVAESVRTMKMGKMRYAVRTPADIDQVSEKMHAVVPVLEVSCVTGEGLDLLRRLLFVIPKRRLHSKKMKRPFELLVEDQFNVTGVGLVLSGFVNTGKAKKGDNVFVGPLKDGAFVKAVVKSIHVAQTFVDEVWAGHSACFAVSLTRKQRSMLPRKGLVVLCESSCELATGFTAEIVLVKGESVTMVKGQTQTTMHILHLKQTCKLQDFETYSSNAEPLPQTEKMVLRPGQRANASFNFLGGPQHIRTGMRIIFRDGHVRGIGMIKEVHSMS